VFGWADVGDEDDDAGDTSSGSRCHCGDFLSVKINYPSSHNHLSMENESIMLEGTFSAEPLSSSQ